MTDSASANVANSNETPGTVTTGPLPSSRKVFVKSANDASVNVAMREVDLEPSSGEAPVRI